MSSTATDVHPALRPIRTTTPAPEPAACSSAASSSSTAPAPDAESVATLPSAEKKQQQEQGEADSEAQQEETEPTTPTSEGSQLRAPAECPPAPRKPAWAPPSTPAAKRKFPSSAAPSARRAFFPVARDLTTVFRALPPPKKRIRAG
ncbi:cyclin-dependent protein kinase inhibitor SMR1-like [Miscanthus floridulus]|uniref:cyclin-dependent protein kinase inhibitor SMR1-like n=1 Tax=Miscanthus floridulus TaxID=154761 RepID=UPI003457CFA2